MGVTRISSSLGIKTIILPAGKLIFQGVPGVAFKGCQIAETPFTNGQFRKLLELMPKELANIVKEPQKLLDASVKLAALTDEAEDCPLVRIKPGETMDVLAMLGGRLPTELEWERAAAYTDGRIYPFGNQFNEQCAAFNEKGTRSVFAHPEGKSPEGFYDLAGNIWEWTSSYYGKIDLSDPQNPKFPGKGNTYVVRGGCWYFEEGIENNLVLLRGDYRLEAGPNTRNGAAGFRFAMNLL